MAKKSKQKHKGLSYHKKRAWDEFSKYIRARDWHEQGEMFRENTKVAKCVTCPKIYPIEGVGTMQAGHFMPGRANEYLFDEQEVHAQCYNCNMNLKGNWTSYFDFMVNKFNKTKVYEMMAKKNNYKKYTIPELIELRAKYRELWKSISE